MLSVLDQETQGIKGKELGVYLVIGQTQIIPSSEPEIRRKPSSENTMHLIDL